MKGGSVRLTAPTGLRTMIRIDLLLPIIRGYPEEAETWRTTS
jgi:hypothetical protein